MSGLGAGLEQVIGVFDGLPTSATGASGEVRNLVQC
jgi:hypothetical protein